MLTYILRSSNIQIVEYKSTEGGIYIMTNTLELELAIKRVNITKKEVAERLGISDMSLYKKIHNVTEFKASEIAKLYKILKLKDLEEQQSIFFMLNVENKSTA